MALGTTDISTTLVGNTIGNTSRDVGVLCTAPTINPWSRVRPGYWNAPIDGNNEAIFQYHQPDGTTTDPRGTEPNTGDAIEHFRLGDFRGYNHNAQAPYTPANATLNYDPADAGNSATRILDFYLQEFNWQNTGVYREKNGLVAATTMYIKDLNGNVKGTVDISSAAQNTYVQAGYDFTVPNAGVTTTWSYEIWMGTALGAGGADNSIYAVRDASGNKITGTFSIHTRNYPDLSISASNFTISSTNYTLNVGDTDLDFGFHVDSGLGATAVAINAVLKKDDGQGGEITVDTVNAIVHSKDNDTVALTDVFTINPAAAYDEHYHIYLSK